MATTYSAIERNKKPIWNPLIIIQNIETNKSTNDIIAPVICPLIKPFDLLICILFIIITPYSEFNFF